MDTKTSKMKWITAVVLIAGIIMIIMGAARGEVATVLVKATSICMQCIGIN